MKRLKTLLVVVAVILGLGFVGSLFSNDSDKKLAESATSSFSEKSVIDEDKSDFKSSDDYLEVTTSIDADTPSTKSTNNQSSKKILLNNGKNTSSVRPNSTIPEYSGKAFVEINNNIPSFTSADKKIKTAFERYSELDSLGRCGIAYANICKDIMPTEKRGEIGAIKPSGWQSVRYNGLVEGNYLYNRCHLIGFQLAGENANPKNLITGTRYLNTQGMLPFENMVTDFVKETNFHVLYRVTPVFVGSELVARGVQIEAYSVEDSGDGISFNVFCFNTQPGVVIDYSNGDSHLDESTTTLNNSTKNQSTTKKTTTKASVSVKPQSSSGSYIGNINTKKFHKTSCSSVKQMSEKNKYYFTGSRDEIISKGYAPCKNCNP